MKIKNLQNLEVFVHTAERGGLSAAARAMDISPAVASAALKRLEAELGVMLLVRSTRSLRLTLEGERLLARCKPLLDGLRDAEEEMLAGRVVIRGQLQLSMPSDLGRNLLLPWLDAFQRQYPDIQLRLQLSDRLADIYRQPVDIAIRYGEPADSTLVALPLLPDNRRVLCAAPAYVQRHGTPQTPLQLAGHNCLCLLLGESLYDRWCWQRDGKEVTVQVRGDRIADDSDAVRRWTLQGHGIAYRSYLDVAADLAAGRLQQLCADWQGDHTPLYLVCADRRQLSPTVRLLREFLEQRCQTHLLDPLNAA